MQGAAIQSLSNIPVINPTYLNIEYVFAKILDVIKPAVDSVSDPKTWTGIGIFAIVVSIICIGIIVFSLIRISEIQSERKDEINKNIYEFALRKKEEECSKTGRSACLLLVGSLLFSS